MAASSTSGTRTPAGCLIHGSVRTCSRDSKMNELKLIADHVILALPLIGAYALFGLGIVVIYRASRVLNLAHGAIVMLPGYIAYSAAPRVGPVLGLLVGILSGGV